METLPKSAENTKIISAITKATSILALQLSNLIQIIPRTPFMIWDSNASKCGTVVVPTKDKKLGNDSDLHLYLAYTVSSSSFLAFASWCRLIPGIGATHG